MDEDPSGFALGGGRQGNDVFVWCRAGALQATNDRAERKGAVKGKPQ